MVPLGPVALDAFAASPADGKPTVTDLPRPARPRPVKDRGFDPHTLLVRFESGVSAAAEERALGKRGARRAGAVPGTGYVKVRTTGPAPDVLRQLRKDPAVKRVGLDFRRRIAATPNDPFYFYGDQNYLKTVRLPQAWDRTKGSTSQVIAVVDTGVNTAHEDLVGRTVTGYNAITPGTVVTDGTGHGSMVAGIAAANTNNGIGVAGVAWTAKVMPVKVLDAEGTGYDSDIAEGVRWAADHGAKIINLSLGGPNDSPILHDAISYATGRRARTPTVKVMYPANEPPNTTSRSMV